MSTCWSQRNYQHQPFIAVRVVGLYRKYSLLCDALCDLLTSQGGKLLLSFCDWHEATFKGEMFPFDESAWELSHKNNLFYRKNKTQSWSCLLCLPSAQLLSDGTEAVRDFSCVCSWVCVLVCLCSLVVEGGSRWAAGGEVMGRMKSRSKWLSQQDIKVFVFFTHEASLYKDGLYLAPLYNRLTSPPCWN